MSDLGAYIDYCAPEVGRDTMAAIVRVESKGNPWALFDNTTGRPVKTFNYGDAVSKAKSLIASGHSVDMGLAQINSKNLPRLRMTVEEVMEPCRNLMASSYVLRSFYHRASALHGNNSKALMHALSGYNTGSLTRGSHYAWNVVAAANGLTLVSPPAAQPKPSRTSQMVIINDQVASDKQMQ